MTGGRRGYAGGGTASWGALRGWLHSWFGIPAFAGMTDGAGGNDGRAGGNDGGAEWRGGIAFSGVSGAARLCLCRQRDKLGVAGAFGVHGWIVVPYVGTGQVGTGMMGEV